MDGGVVNMALYSTLHEASDIPIKIELANLFKTQAVKSRVGAVVIER